ncbi:hypothetical protein BALOs_2746 [Halobacteriovorax sp. BALOs_7]|nr:hypothetical protein BALOs_2746 [Halobacteriovorax sp. BALOs_7]
MESSGEEVTMFKGISANYVEEHSLLGQEKKKNKSVVVLFR